MCERCAELEERVAWLESELGIQQRLDVEARIHAALGGGGKYAKRSGTTRLISALYGAKGRPMSRYQLEEALPSPNDRERTSNIVNVYVSFARSKLGKAAIETVWGRGYRMSPAGMAKVAELLGEDLRPAVAA